MENQLDSNNGWPPLFIMFWSILDILLRMKQVNLKKYGECGAKMHISSMTFTIFGQSRSVKIVTSHAKFLYKKIRMWVLFLSCGICMCKCVFHMHLCLGVIGRYMLGCLYDFMHRFFYKKNHAEKSWILICPYTVLFYVIHCAEFIALIIPLS